jgi:hypothetical protein
MKRLFILAISILFIGATAFAQAKNPKTTTLPVHSKTVMKKDMGKTQVKQSSSINKKEKNSTASVVTTTNTKTATKLKKDGTPDRRFKENKTNVTHVVAGPKKKDGSPDMRYKSNKKKG